MKTTIILVALVILTATSSASAAPITVPTDLNVDDTYRLAFVTSTTRDATSSNIADYNSFVAAVAAGQAELLSLGTTWKAIGSTSDDDARDNTDTNPNVWAGVPIYLLNDTKLVDDNADLWDGSIDVPLSVTQLGSVIGGIVWTGTTFDGLANSKPLGFGPSFHPSHGKSELTNSEWIDFNGGLPLPPPSVANFYAMSGVLTVIPEPTTCTLALAALCLAMSRRRAC